MDFRTTSMQMMVAALAMVGSYGDVAITHQPISRLEVECNHLELAQKRKVLKSLIDGWTELDRIYADTLRVSLKRADFSRAEFAKVGELLSATRALETALKAAEPPAELRGEHMAFRRIVAGTRSRLAALDSLHRQATHAAEYVESSIDFNGLRELASHTTARLGLIA
ncbi:hypothetical protein [Pseudomonas viridiflava]|uniref:hypothetical protein n=1 Tax=Pseudomonas viridiflava TaxID=33069 RepID=UPI001C319C54|nr:hypothetical protein [Pseudomonas viridiflava]QXG29091.1 hypothetical protein KTT59_19130 [Pseudomonas viridiflava]